MKAQALKKRTEEQRQTDLEKYRKYRGAQRKADEAEDLRFFAENKTATPQQLERLRELESEGF